MARLIDESKIVRIKEATIQLVVLNGFGNASISEIARRAGVAEGYLYRHYKGKTELVEDLLNLNMNQIVDKLEELLEKQYSVSTIIEQLIRALFEIANQNPDRIKFLYVLMNDYNFNIQEAQRQRIYSLCTRIKEKGLASGELNTNTEEEDIYLLGVTIPIQFINYRLKNFFNRSELGENEINKLLNICKINKCENYEG
jgi:TetR/AcrR family transcriptional regulator, repressor of fatR-cypB operon